MTLHTIDLGDRKIGHSEPCFIIAEAGVNHDGSLETALQLVDVAVDAGADAVKFQTYTAGLVVSENAPKAAYQMETTDTSESQLDMAKRLELPYDAFRRIKDYCEERGIIFISTPFDLEAADFLDELDVVAFKTPSGEVVNIPYLDHIARKGKPMIVSTGMSKIGEVETAVATIKAAGNDEIVLLHCVSNYPTDPADVNLRAMATMSSAFGLLVGFSDHTLGIEVTVAARALGACVIEKHYTLDRGRSGPDHGSSLEPDELGAMVRGIRKVEVALGDGRKEPAASEANTSDVARRSLLSAAAIPAGTVLTKDLIAILRPGTGLPPAMRDQVIGMRARQHIDPGVLLSLAMLEW